MRKDALVKLNEIARNMSEAKFRQSVYPNHMFRFTLNFDDTFTLWLLELDDKIKYYPLHTSRKVHKLLKLLHILCV